jgi:hypothetical protein
MTLSQCTKADLLWIIKRLQIRCRYDVDRALNDLAYEKEKERIAEAERCYKLADKKRREYLEILEPYDGKKIVDIPLSVLKKADKAMKEAQDADNRWAKLMGLDINFGTSAKDGDGK